MNEAHPRILYVDDDEGLRFLVRKALSRRGFEVSLCASGPEGLAAVEAERFDLVAIDHYMPGQNGLETLAALRAIADCPPVVYVTGTDETRIAVAALKAGATDYVVKTVGEDFFDLLAGTFRQALERVALERSRAALDAELRASHARLEALLKEMNHRVANSLQLVSAFVQMQARTVEGGAAREALEATQQRIQAIVQVHRRLYSDEGVERIAVDGYLRSLGAELQQGCATGSGERRILVDADTLDLDADRVVSLGIIVNELASNACKYAYAPDAHGDVRIALRREAATFVLTIEDDGPGLPADGTVHGTGLGTKLMRRMADAMRATLTFEDGAPGLRAVLRAPIAAR